MRFKQFLTEAKIPEFVIPAFFWFSDDFANSVSMTLNSAIEIWMSEDSIQKLMMLVRGGVTLKCTNYERQTKAAVKNGWTLFEEEHNFDSYEGILYKKSQEIQYPKLYYYQSQNLSKIPAGMNMDATIVANLAFNNLSDFENLPHNTAHCFLNSNKYTSLSGIHKQLKDCYQLDIEKNPIKESVLGLLLIKGLYDFSFEGVPAKAYDAIYLIMKHHRHEEAGDVLEAKAELIEKGFSQYAKL
jgi:hypothetical protein